MISLTLSILTSSVLLKPGSPLTLPLLALLTSPLPATLSSASPPPSTNLHCPHSLAPSAAELPSLFASPFLLFLSLLQPILVSMSPQSHSNFCLPSLQSLTSIAVLLLLSILRNCPHSLINSRLFSHLLLLLLMNLLSLVTSISTLMIIPTLLPSSSPLYSLPSTFLSMLTFLPIIWATLLTWSSYLRAPVFNR